MYHPDSNPALENAWTTTEQLILKFRDNVEAHGASFLLAIPGSPMQANPNREEKERYYAAVGTRDLFQANRKMESFATANHIQVIDLSEPFAREAAIFSRLLYGFAGHAPGIGHWNQEGHALAGRILADQVSTITPITRQFSTETAKQ